MLRINPVKQRRAAPLRVAHVVECLKSGGAEMMVRTLTAGLRERGVDVRIVSIYDDRLDDRERRELGVPLVTIGRRNRRDVAFFPRLIGALREMRPDVVHAHVSAGKYAGRFAAMLAGIPAIVFTEHGDDVHDPLRFAINRVLHARTQRFITFSDAQRRRFARRERVPLSKVVVIPNGVGEPPDGNRDELRAALGLPAAAFVLYLAARLGVEKNQHLALGALAELHRRGKAWHLVLAGAGPLEGALRAEAAALELARHVHFLGFRDDAAQLMRAMDAFVMPSLRESMPLALGEAMRAGLPVAIVPWDGASDLVSDGLTGFVAHATTVDAFAEALLRLDDAVQRNAVAARGKIFAEERFDLEASTAAHVALYEELARPVTP